MRFCFLVCRTNLAVGSFIWGVGLACPLNPLLRTHPAALQMGTFLFFISLSTFRHLLHPSLLIHLSRICTLGGRTVPSLRRSSGFATGWLPSLVYLRKSQEHPFAQDVDIIAGVYSSSFPLFSPVHQTLNWVQPQHLLRCLMFHEPLLYPLKSHNSSA